MKMVSFSFCIDTSATIQDILDIVVQGHGVFTEFLVLFSVTFQEKIKDDEKNSLAIIDFPEKW